MVPECRCIHKDDPLNLKQQTARLEIRNFFSSRVVDAWNMVSSTETTNSFKMAYRKHRVDKVENA
jgi:hypothetical protein